MSSNEIPSSIESSVGYVKHECIVVGAGVSGLTAARELNDSGSDVLVLEKARGTGGRLGSKNISLKCTQVKGIESTDKATFDLGASTFTAKNVEFKHYLATLIQQGVVAKLDENAYVALPRNSMLTRHMSSSLNVSFSTKVTRIERIDGTWFLFGEAQADTRQPQVSNNKSEKDVVVEKVIACCQHLVLSAPAEQTNALLPNGHAAKSFFYDINSDPVFVSCFILPFNTIKQETLNKIKSHAGQVISNVSIEHKKPHRKHDAQQIIKLTASVEWSKQNVNKEPDEISALLKAGFSDILLACNSELPSVIEQYTHRWLYAHYSNLIQNTKGYLSFSDDLHVVGDYFDLPCDGEITDKNVDGIERSYISAQKLVSHILESDFSRAVHSQNNADRTLKVKDKKYD